MRAFEYRHTVTFQETNVVGNVYFSNHVAWQGRCREMFLKQHAPRVLRDLEDGLSLVTLHVSCEYFDELHAFDELVIKMFAKEVTTSRLTMSFQYIRESRSGPQLVASGEQRVAAMRLANGSKTLAELPAEMVHALAKFSGD